MPFQLVNGDADQMIVRRALCSWPRRVLRLIVTTFYVAGPVIFSATAARATDVPLVIYYANDTLREDLDSENYKSLINLLTNVPAVDAIQRLTADARTYESTVDKDINDLTAAAFYRHFNLAAISNRLALQQRLLSVADGMVDLSAVKLIIDHNPVTEYSPLSRRENFEAVIRSAVRSMKPITSVILIINSHGTRHFAVVPRVAVDFTHTDAAKFIEQLRQHDDNDLDVTEVALQGISKREMWRTLQKLSGELVIKFPLVVFNACESGMVSWTDVFALPGSVEAIAHTGFGTTFPGQVQYDLLLQDQSDERANLKDLTVDLSHLFNRYGFWTSSKISLWLWPFMVTISTVPLAVYFLPFVVWCLTLSRIRPWTLLVGTQGSRGRNKSAKCGL